MQTGPKLLHNHPAIHRFGLLTTATTTTDTIPIPISSWYNNNTSSTNIPQQHHPHPIPSSSSSSSTKRTDNNRMHNGIRPVVSTLPLSSLLPTTTTTTTTTPVYHQRSIELNRITTTCPRFRRRSSFSTTSSHNNNNIIEERNNGDNRRSSSRDNNEDNEDNDNDGTLPVPKPKRVWRTDTDTLGPDPSNKIEYWKQGLHERNLSSMRDALDRVLDQERQGGRMRQRKLGVLREEPKEDMRLLVENYTAPALASALRDREDVLQTCATLLAENKIDELSVILRPFEQKYVNRRRQKELNLDLTTGFNTSTLEMLRNGLNRMPRRVTQAHQRRAGVVLPLCNVDSVPCILFEKRSRDLRAHPDEVCLPGGMVSSISDRSIVATCLREMQEEIDGLDADTTKVLGALRCNWGEVHHLVGVAVTPVVCFVGEIGNKALHPNPDEVAECFTVPLALFLDRDRWVHREDFAPIFTGGPHIIWGLTGYIINRFVKDVLARYRIQVPSCEK